MYEQALKAVGEIIQEYDRLVWFNHFVFILLSLQNICVVKPA